MYSYALNASQVLSHYLAGSSQASPPPPPPAPPPAPPAVFSCRGAPAYSQVVLADNPWAWWRLQETSGTVANDCSVSGSHPATYASAAVTLATLGRGAGNAAAVAPTFSSTSATKTTGGFVTLPTIPASTVGGPFAASFSIEARFGRPAFFRALVPPPFSPPFPLPSF